MRDTTITGALSAPANIIVRSLTDVNQQLERGPPFFIDIVRDGIALYEAEGFCFAQPRKLPLVEAKAEARAYFDKWFPSADAFLASAKFLTERGDTNEAAFNFHQAAERMYHCTLLTLTLYSPESHRLNFLRSQYESIAPELIAAWPRDDKFSRRCYNYSAKPM